jgi:hypothetical protein
VCVWCGTRVVWNVYAVRYACCVVHIWYDVPQCSIVIAQALHMMNSMKDILHR